MSNAEDDFFSDKQLQTMKSKNQFFYRIAGKLREAKFLQIARPDIDVSEIYCEAKIDNNMENMFVSQVTSRSENPFWGEDFKIDNRLQFKELKVVVYTKFEEGGEMKQIPIGKTVIPYDMISSGREEWYPLNLASLESVATGSVVCQMKVVPSKCDDDVMSIISDIEGALNDVNIKVRFINAENFGLGDDCNHRVFALLTVFPGSENRGEMVRVRVINLIILLKADNFILLRILGKVSPLREEAARCLIRIFNNSYVDFLAALIRSEIMDAPDTNTLFRANSMASKALDVFMKNQGTEYLIETLQPILVSLIESNEPFELDPTRIENAAGDYKELHTANLIKMNESVANAIFTSAEKMPKSLQFLFATIQSTVKERFPEEENVMYTAVSGFIFLRFFTPAILGPSLFGLKVGFLNEKNKRKLTLVAKTMQNLSNLAEFGGKEPYMSPINAFINDKKPALKTFIDTISQPIFYVANPVNYPTTDTEKDCAELVVILLSSIDKLANFEPECDLVFKLLPILTHIDQKGNGARSEFLDVEGKLVKVKNIVPKLKIGSRKDSSIMSPSSFSTFSPVSPGPVSFGTNMVATPKDSMASQAEQIKSLKATLAVLRAQSSSADMLVDVDEKEKDGSGTNKIFSLNMENRYYRMMKERKNRYLIAIVVAVLMIGGILGAVLAVTQKSSNGDGIIGGSVKADNSSFSASSNEALSSTISVSPAVQDSTHSAEEITTSSTSLITTSTAGAVVPSPHVVITSSPNGVIAASPNSNSVVSKTPNGAIIASTRGETSTSSTTSTGVSIAPSNEVTSISSNGVTVAAADASPIYTEGAPLMTSYLSETTFAASTSSSLDSLPSLSTIATTTMIAAQPVDPQEIPVALTTTNRQSRLVFTAGGLLAAGGPTVQLTNSQGDGVFSYIGSSATLHIYASTGCTSPIADQMTTLDAEAYVIFGALNITQIGTYYLSVTVPSLPLSRSVLDCEYSERPCISNILH